MFSGLFQSPKTLLASSISKYLAEYFEVDPASIESNLVSNTKIVLRETKLKPTNPLAGCLLVGDVAHVEFSWKWGGATDGSTSFIRETVLTIRGADFRVVPIPGQSASLSQRPISDAEIESKGGYMDYLKKHLNQIVDHLTLNLTDVRVVFESSSSAGANSSSLVLEAESIQLLSLGRKDNGSEEDSPPLSQRVSMGSFKAYVVQEGQNMPLVDPVAYSMCVERVSGKRFQGIDQGLSIRGSECQDVLGVHLGAAQLAVLSELSDSFKDLANGVNTVTGDVSPQEAQDSPESTLPTSFLLPLPSMVVHLPNAATVSMPRCVLKYVMDGSIFEVSGRKGIDVNEKEILLPLNGASWLIDVAKSEFVVAQSEHETSSSMANIDMDQTTLKDLVEGLQQLSKKSTTIVETVALSTSETLVETSCCWCLLLQGDVELSLTNNNDEWIRGGVGPLSVTIDFVTSSITQFELAEITLGPCSFGSAEVSIPAISLDEPSGVFSVDKSVVATATSIPVLSNIQCFFESFVDILPTSGLAPTPKPFTIPYTMRVPTISLTLSSPVRYDCKLDDLKLNGKKNVLELKTLVVTRSDGLRVQASGVVITPTPAMLIKRIDSLHIPGFVKKLAKPIEEVALEVVDQCLSVSFISADVLVEDEWASHELVGDSSSVSVSDFPLTSMKLSILESLKIKGVLHQSELLLNMGPIQGTAAILPGNDGLSLRSNEPTEFLIKTDRSSLKGKLSQSFCLISLETYMLHSCKSKGAELTFGSSEMAFGRVELKPDSRLLKFYDPARISIESMADIDGLNCMFASCDSAAETSTISLWETMQSFAFSAISCPSLNINLLGKDGMVANIESVKVQQAGSQNESLLGTIDIAMAKVNLVCSDTVALQATPVNIRCDLLRTGFFSALSKGMIGLYLSHPSKTQFLGGNLGPSTILLAPNLKFTRFSAMSFAVNKGSMGIMTSFSLPRFVYDALSSKFTVEDMVSVCFDSFKASTEFLALVETSLDAIYSTLDMLGIDSGGQLKMASLPSCQISCGSPTVLASLHDVTQSECTSTFQRIEVTAMGHEAVATNVTYDSGSVLVVGGVEKLVLLGHGRLLTPLTEAIRMQYSQTGGVCAEIPPITILAEGSANPGSNKSPATQLSFPFPIAASFRQVTCRYCSANTTESVVEGVQVLVRPEHHTGSGAFQFQVQAANIQHEMLKVQALSTSGSCSTTQKLLSGMKVELGSVVLSAGYSSLDWSALFSENSPPEKTGDDWKIPHIHIAAVVASLSLKGTLVSTSGNIKLPSFNGSANCKLDDIVEHYSSAATERLPLLLTNAEVAGRNVSEVGAQVIASKLLQSSVMGSVTGSVAGVAAVDGIRGVLASGKEARGATAEDSYRFGDISRGSVRAVSKAAKMGAAMRGDDTYEVGDLTVGAAQYAGKYAVENKEKLGAAGGSTVGMILGAAALGPVGLVAGAVAGGSAASRALRKKTEELPQKQSDFFDDRSPAQPREFPPSHSQELLDFSANTLPQQHPHPRDQCVDRSVTNRQSGHHDGTLQYTAGGSTVGMILGAAALGPIGLVAGAVAGGAAASRALRNNTEERPQNDFFDDPPPAQQHTTNSQELLGFSATTLPQQQSQPRSQYTSRSTSNTQSHQYSMSHRAQYPSANPDVGNNVNGDYSSTFLDARDQSFYASPPAPYYPQTQQYQPPHSVSQPSSTSYHQQMSRQQQAAMPPASYHHQLQEQQQHLNASHPSSASYNHDQAQQQQASGYRFGDLTRSVVAKGKKGRGANVKEGYKFGDFTRGLFG